MKKIVSIACMLSLLITALAGCDGVAEQHDHVFGNDWKHDTDYHWHACTASDGCNAYAERNLHDFAVDLDEEGNTVNVCTVCGYKNDRVNTAPEHEHTFGGEYKFSDNFHWYECTAEGCYETSKSREHQFGNPDTVYADGKMTLTYTCVDCGFEKSETTVVDAKVDSAVEWDALFGSFKLTNFTMDVYMTHGAETQHNHCIAAEDALYYHIPDYVEMYIAKTDGQWVGYGEHEYSSESTSTSKFALMDGTQEELQQACENYTRETILQISFAENFDKFVYNEAEGTYTSTERITATYYDHDGEIAGVLYCFNSVVKVMNGQIIYISSDYDFGEDEDSTTYRFIYANIGMSEVSIPQYVIDEANENDSKFPIGAFGGGETEDENRPNDSNENE